MSSTFMEKRILVTGYSGSGKSTMARRLGEYYQCDVLHLDCVHWLPGWEERDGVEENKMVSEFMDKHDSWVIDGNYQSLCYDRRMEEAAQIIVLDFPVHICLYRVLKRFFSYHGKSRESIAEGCEEKIDREFLWWVLYAGRDKSHREWYWKICEDYADKMVVLRNPREVNQFWKEIQELADR